MDLITITTPDKFGGNGWVSVALNDDPIFGRDVVTTREFVELLGVLGIASKVERVVFMSAYDMAEALSAFGYDVMVMEVDQKNLVH